MQRNYNKNMSFMQEFSEKISEENNVPIFSEKKKKTNYLAFIEREIGNHAKAERLEICGTSLVFEKAEEGLHLVFGNFCRVRLCPMCAWRRTAKLQAQMLKISEYLGEDYGFIFLTLTVKNCNADDLRATLNKLQYAWQKFKNYKQIKKIMRGYYRGIEVKYDSDELITEKRYNRAKAYYERQGLRPGDKNPNYEKCHPHYHVIIAVPRSYFTSRDYIRQETFREIWQNCLNVDYTVQVNVQAVKPRRPDDKGVRSAVNEVTKYAVKDTDYLTGDYHVDTRAVAHLERQLHDQRFVSLGGCFKAAHAALNLTDYDDPDGDAPTTLSDASKLVAFCWHVGVSRYNEDPPYVKAYMDYEAARKQQKN